ncbi:MAG: hypothetical protein FJ319_00860 [SAR202 cluster bacterium]|nr:hypothetical protein [SAR202 cluster bacterium]
MKLRTLVLIGSLFALGISAAVACTPDADPFAVGQRQDERIGTATPRPLGATPVVVDGEEPTVDDTPAKGVVNFAEVNDNTVKIVNFITAYVIVYGYFYTVELVTPAGEA